MEIDAMLVSRAKNGDREAFEELYTLIYKDLYKYAYYMLGNKEDAVDLVSDTVCDAYKGIKGLKENKLFKVWIIKILSNKCKIKRKEYVDKYLSFDEEYLYNESNHTVNNNSDDLLDACERVDIRKALQNVSVEEREIVILSAVYGYNSKEIGQMLNKKSGTIRSKLNRTLEKLKERLVAYE